MLSQQMGWSFDDAERMMLFTTMPFEAFCLDARFLNVEEDESRLPIRWLAAAQVAARLGQATRAERKQVLKVWIDQTAAAARDEHGVWTALTVPGIEIRNLGTAGAALIAIGSDALAAGGKYLACCIATNTRLALMEAGPVERRVYATLLQADSFRAIGKLDEARMTYEAALDDAVRARDAEAEKTVRARLQEL